MKSALNGVTCADWEEVGTLEVGYEPLVVGNAWTLSHYYGAVEVEPRGGGVDGIAVAEVGVVPHYE
ncbi:MAG: hypothetical protein ACP5T2_07125, partial [Thermoprotei archaeon]